MTHHSGTKGKHFLRTYWVIAFIYSVLLGEIILPSIVGHPLPLLDHPVGMLAYYAVLSLAMAYLIRKIGIRRSLVGFFVYGVVAEWLFFKNVQGLTDIPGVLFFGGLYVFLFGVPYLLVKVLGRRY